MKFLNKITTVLIVGIIAISTLALVKYAPLNWNIDKSHSAVNFKITHFFTPVNGQFNDYEGEINFDPDNLEESSIDVQIAVNSVDTKNERRDGHLRTDDFFNAEKWPYITFKSNHIKSTGENEYVAHGTLTIKDVSKEIELPFTLLGMIDHPRREGTKIAGITASTKLDRTEFGVGTGDWASNAVVGNEVTVDINLELNAKVE